MCGSTAKVGRPACPRVSAKRIRFKGGLARLRSIKAIQALLEYETRMFSGCLLSKIVRNNLLPIGLGGHRWWMRAYILLLSGLHRADLGPQ